jgi:hypothetical protein
VTDAAGDREQDVGRRHRRTGEPEPILERYRDAMRAELADLLDELRPATGQLTIAGDIERPKLEQRRALWDLAVKLGRELAGMPAADPPPTQLAAVVSPKRAAPRLTAAARRQLGG